MNIEISKMTTKDFEQIKENLVQDFDNFWTPKVLEQELENINRFKLLHSSKGK